MTFSDEVIQGLKAVSLAMSAGLAKYLNDYLNGRKFEWSKAVAQIIVSGFTGYLAYLLAGRLYPDWAGFAAGIGGFGGGQMLGFIITVWKHRIEKHTGPLDARVRAGNFVETKEKEAE